MIETRAAPDTEEGAGPDPAGSLAPIWWERFLGATERFLFDRPAWLLLAVLALADLVKNGAAEDPNVGIWLRIARAFPGNPHLPAGVQYQQASPIGPALAHLLGIRGPGGYVTLHVAVIVTALGVLVVGLGRVGGRPAVTAGLVAFLATPLSNILLSVGAQDPFTFLFASMAVLFESPLLAVVAGAGLAASHLEVGIFTVVAVTVLRVLDDRPLRPATAMGLVGGLLATAGAVVGYEHHAGVGLSARASFIHRTGLRVLLGDFLDELPTWLFSTFGAFWLFAVVTCSRWWALRTVRALAVLATGAGLVTVVTLDETRVFALLTWPLVLWLTLLAVRRLEPGTLRRLTALTFLAALVLPRIIVFEGRPAVSYASDLIGPLLRHL